jgi:transposase
MAEEQRAKRRAYDEAFKRDAVALMLKGDRTLMQLARDLGVSHWNLREWRKQYGPAAPVRTMEEMEAELRALRRENESLRGQRDILKETLGILVEPPSSGTRA